MSKLYWNFVFWMETLSMEEVFIFTSLSIVVVVVLLGLPLSFLTFKAQDNHEDNVN